MMSLSPEDYRKSIGVASINKPIPCGCLVYLDRIVGHHPCGCDGWTLKLIGEHIYSENTRGEKQIFPPEWNYWGEEKKDVRKLCEKASKKLAIEVNRIREEYLT